MEEYGKRRAKLSGSGKRNRENMRSNEDDLENTQSELGEGETAN